KTHTSPKCRKYNSQVRDRVACVQHDLALTMRNLFEMFYARRERSRFDTAKTHCCRRRSSLLALRDSYSINSSALSRIDVGTSKPSALSVVILSTVSYFTDNWTGRSAGFSLLRMRST